MSDYQKNAKPDQEFTGRYLVMFPEGTDTQAALASLTETMGLKVAHSADFPDELVQDSDFEKNEAIYLDQIGVAVVNAVPDQLNRLSLAVADASQAVLIEPERVVYAINELTGEYLKGFRDAVDTLLERTQQTEKSNGEAFTAEQEVQATGVTWGLQAVRGVPSLLYRSYNGSGIKVAVLDTGMDLQHPDFVGRNIVTASFINGQTVQDGHGHGTHCIGTACGPLNPSDPNMPRYGLAYKATIYAGKVLSNEGYGGDAGILAGINWALANKCEVVSMSLGAGTQTQGYSQIFENVAANVLAKGTLIVAAAGNDSNRSNGVYNAVSHPANCPSILAVGAVDKNMKIANFSNRGKYAPYGNVDIVAPGVEVFSSTKMPTKYATWQGTSMATPHVAGIAAFYAQQSKANRGYALWKKLVSTAKPLSIPTTDAGAGLVQGPLSRLILKPWPLTLNEEALTD